MKVGEVKVSSPETTASDAWIDALPGARSQLVPARSSTVNADPQIGP